MTTANTLRRPYEHPIVLIRVQERQSPNFVKTSQSFPADLKQEGDPISVTISFEIRGSRRTEHTFLVQFAGMADLYWQLSIILPMSVTIMCNNSKPPFDTIHVIKIHLSPACTSAASRSDQRVSLTFVCSSTCSGRACPVLRFLNSRLPPGRCKLPICCQPPVPHDTFARHALRSKGLPRLGLI